jgi:hypothetical protein
MNLTRCGKGHFYDQDKFGTNCPHCLPGGLEEAYNLTKPILDAAEDTGSNVTVSLHDSASKTETGNSSLGAIAAAATANAARSGNLTVPGDNSEKTIGIYKNIEKNLGKEPVVGWLVCVEGDHLGEDFRLKAGRNSVGRSSSMDVAITKDATVSRDKHAIIVYEPRQHLFLAQPGESNELYYLNDEVVLSVEELKHHDVLTIGDTKLMFFPCCGSEFNWDSAKKAADAAKEE